MHDTSETASPPITNAGLTAAQCSAFHEQGFLHLPAVISPWELERLRHAAARVMAGASATVLRCGDYGYAHHEGSPGPVLHRINQLQQKQPAFLQLWGHPRLLAIAEDIQGRDLLPLAMAMVIKMPGFGTAVPWHRDPAFATRRWGTNLGIYLDDADAENGMLHVIPGSHRRRGPDLAEAVREHGFDLPGALAVPVRAGDIILHNENVLHGSRHVCSQRQRRVIYFGIRCIDEQLSQRGLDGDWVRNCARVLQHAIHERERGVRGVGAPEVPFQWRPTESAYLPGLGSDAYVELRLEGGDSHGDPARSLPFTQEHPLEGSLVVGSSHT